MRFFEKNGQKGEFRVMFNFNPALEPTMYFIGVTTAYSSIMNIFPRWSTELQLGAAIVGIDLPLNADSGLYREVVSFIKHDPLSLGALVTTHKMNILKAAKTEFDYLDSYATVFEEISSISKKNGRLEGYAKDPISSGLAMEAFIPENFWYEHRGEVLILGSGGSALAISAYLANKKHRTNVPTKITLTNHHEDRLVEARRILSRLETDVTFDFRLCKTPTDTDKLVRNLTPYSMVVNATGMGKDIPGSPVTDNVIFPKNSLVWELNYRGALNFFHQAQKQEEDRNLRVIDGWNYFIHGWTQVITEVFHVEINAAAFRKLDYIAAQCQPQEVGGTHEH